MADYKNTLLMPQTNFPMRGNLGVNEVKIQERWNQIDLYHLVMKKNANNKPFFLHDGPPYANGNIHVGHALNKTLKDFILRYKNMNGYYAPYQPGWDTHGLPIEQALSNNKKVNRKAMSVSEFRDLCDKYAHEQVAKQMVGFKRLGVLADWDDPYLTLKPEFEAEQVRVFAKMVEKGLIFKGLKPVYWSPSSETALAEAEIEYKDVTAKTIFVAFPIVDGKGILSNNCELVIWTTTPWTIPANLAICAHPDFTYVVVETNQHYYVMVKDLVDSVMKEIGSTDYHIVKEVVGRDLEGIQYYHPLFKRTSPVILGNYVTLDSGTGLVHIAPGHGEDDFNVSKPYHLPILCPVDSRGYMTSEAGEFSGMFYEEANDAVIVRLKENGQLLSEKDIVHSYPHDWRTKKPVIFRATPQWFASLDKIKDQMLEAIKNVKWYPSWGEVRLSNMIKDRGDWCISRQRVWGVPIPVFYAEDGEPILDSNVILHVADLFEKYGSNIWFEKDAKELLPEGYTNTHSPNGVFTKEKDIMDVWFDSGSSHHGALLKKYGTSVADLYLEGSDQYRGWFNSSLSTSVAVEGVAPYKTVLSHGFTLDGEGRKMSKSLGNTIDPSAVCNEFGADIFRLWVAGVEYQSDVRISKELIRQASESYRKIRNTFRFLLANLSDFNPSTDSVDYQQMSEVDQYMLCLLNQVILTCHNGYNNYVFADVYHSVLNFMTNELSSFYLDFTKDVLYIDEVASLERRSIQTVFYTILSSLVRILTPIIPHTTEEVYGYMPGKKVESVYLLNMPQASVYDNQEEILQKYNSFMTFRDDVLKALEDARNNKVIGKSLNAWLKVCPKKETLNLLSTLHVNFAQVFIVSKFEIVDVLEDGQEYSSSKISVTPAPGKSCERCWQVREDLDEFGLCPRCRALVNQQNNQ
jgi:isoleucyl-tRNA synthetase